MNPFTSTRLALPLLVCILAPCPSIAQPSPDLSTNEEQAEDLWNFEDEDDDLWNFGDDEEDVETWGALVRDQAPDLALFTLFATLTLVSFFRKSAWLKYVTFVAAIGYMAASLDDSNERYADVVRFRAAPKLRVEFEIDADRCEPPLRIRSFLKKALVQAGTRKALFGGEKPRELSPQEFLKLRC